MLPWVRIAFQQRCEGGWPAFPGVRELPHEVPLCLAKLAPALELRDLRAAAAVRQGDVPLRSGTDFAVDFDGDAFLPGEARG